LVRRQGRIFYWTTVLFLPAVLLLTGVLLARCWAWWTARGVTAIFVLCFVGFIAMIPFGDLRGSEGPVPWWGRVYMMGVTLIFASVAAYVFRALGHSETKAYFGMRLEERTIPEAAK
jgi:prepilin signal peptidase PulO-like enzyme (type II secretory pathway)